MRWIALALIVLLAAGCGNRFRPQPGTLACDQTGPRATLSYRLAGKVRYRLVCLEGRDMVDLRLEPPPPTNRPVKLRAGGGKGEIRLRLWALSPEEGLTFHLRDNFMVHLLGSGRMTANGRRFEVGRDPDTLNARWRFETTCAAARADQVMLGDPAPRSQHAQFAALKVENAAADARRALSRGDRRFATVYGYSRFAPGVEGGGSPDRGTYRDVDPTSDAIRSSDQRAFKDRAHHYAEAYNAVLLAVR